ncbi:PfkB family carbohydrate kinase [Facklamia sp. 7083-14-GEN3]|uniref:PfkB family carbohydrate kinase n=1 Tax=Facklamia sp. 7083-14-GEN3 TaxID=2973478 RepID=UPI00215C7B25|nr:PfkB family carbohydrate kinase [Facklamia sp. 7083-14-GEN3]MCR8968656.1 PfkB family carbohydrate kinase [Facklamia sp. 7083-14-GEN3]
MFSLNSNNYSNTILVVNDIPGAGRVAGSINLPVLAAAQLEAAILPTLILSSHAGEQGNLVRYPMGNAFHEILQHWQEVDYHFDAILTGYFADTKQIDDLKDYLLKEKEINPNIALFMDPIMGDHGQFYAGFDQDVAHHLRELIPHVELIMPNLTEACLILGRDYKEDFKLEEIAEIAEDLLALGCNNVIITGAKDDRNNNNRLGFYYASQSGEKGLVVHEYFEGYVFGTGDTVASIITASRIAGDSLKDSVRLTADIIEKMIPFSISQNESNVGPIHFEPFIKEISSYFTQKKESRF